LKIQFTIFVASKKKSEMIRLSGSVVLFLGLLILGAWCVSEGGDILGEKYDATIIGGFVIAWLNTAPETIFFITALETGQPHFAMGAISGSVIVVSTIAVGACVYIGANARKNQTIFLFPDVRKQAFLLGSSLLVLVCVLLFGFKKWIGYFGLGFYSLFILWTLFHKSSVSSAAPSDLAHDHAHMTSIPLEKHDESDEEEENQSTWKGVAYLIAGGLIIYICSEPFINCVVAIGKGLGIAPLALAFFFGPIASEAPEILESVSLSRKGKTQNINIAFSNLVGGTISKTTLLLGIFCLYSVDRGYQWVDPTYSVSLFLVLLCAGAAAAFGLAAEHKAIKGVLLMTLFLFCATTQFTVSYFGQ
jgi:Ca2+/Na+ antiporter